MREMHVEYRDNPFGEWKRSHAGHDFTTTEFFNKVCGYKKYRWV